MIGTIKQVNQEVARELSIDEDIVNKVNKFFWEKGVKDAVRTAEYTSIRIRGLGTLVTSRFKLNKFIFKLIREIRFLRSTDKEYKNTTKEDLLKEKYILLDKYLFRRNELAKAFYIQQMKRINYLKNNPKS